MNIRWNRLIAPFAAAAATIAFVVCGAVCVRAQATPSSASITYKLTPTVSADSSTLTLTISATNSLAPSTSAQSFTFNATTNETPPRSFTANAIIPAVSNLINGPIVTVPIQQATSSLAGLAAPAALPSGVAISGNILTWTPGKIDGGNTATVAVTFQVVQPTGGQSAIPGAAGSHS